MSDQYLGEIRLFSGNYAPRDWAMCDGSALSISQNQALYAVIGITYGGDGVTTFNLPDLRGRVLVHMGTGSSGTNYSLGQYGGVEEVTLAVNNLPSHSHAFNADAAPNEVSAETPANAFVGSGSINAYSNATTPNVQMDAASVQNAGGGLPHENMMPFVALTFIIALQGNFPSSQ